jgi:hypothetical protein
MEVVTEEGEKLTHGHLQYALPGSLGDPSGMMVCLHVLIIMLKSYY